MWSKIWYYLLTSPFSPKVPSQLFMTQVASKWLFIHKDFTKLFTVLPLSIYTCVSLVAQLVKNLPPMWETWVWSLDWEDPLKKGMADQCSILAWRIPWTCIVHGVTESQTQLFTHRAYSKTCGWEALLIICIWLSTVYGFTEIQTQLIDNTRN